MMKTFFKFILSLLAVQALSILVTNHAGAALRCSKLFVDSDSGILERALSKFRKSFDVIEGQKKSLAEVIGPADSEHYVQWISSWNGVLWKNMDTVLNATTAYNFSVYHGDVYVNQWFANNRLVHRELLLTEDLARIQPWLKWSASGKNFEMKTTDASVQILSHLAKTTGDIELYRGLSETEISVFNAALKMREEGASDQTLLAHFKAHWHSVKKDSIFFSGTLAGAEQWSGHILKVVLPKSSWLKWAEQNHIYVGIEYGYPEVGIFSDQSLIYLLRNFQFSGDLKSKAPTSSYR